MERITILILVCITYFEQSFSQTIVPSGLQSVKYYKYDVNGNRTKARVLIEPCNLHGLDPDDFEDDSWMIPKSFLIKETVKPQELGVTLYPNPTSDNVNLTINTSEELSNAQLYVFDCTGKQVYSKSNILNKTAEIIPLSGLPFGKYLVVLHFNDKKVSTWKIIKE